MVIFYRYVRKYQRVYIYRVNGDFILWDTHAINVPFGDCKHTTHKDGDDWGMVYDIGFYRHIR